MLRHADKPVHMGALGHRAAPTDTSHARTDISHVQKDSERDAWELAKTGKKAVLEVRPCLCRR